MTKYEFASMLLNDLATTFIAYNEDNLDDTIQAYLDDENCNSPAMNLFIEAYDTAVESFVMLAVFDEITKGLTFDDVE